MSQELKLSSTGKVIVEQGVEYITESDGTIRLRCKGTTPTPTPTPTPAPISLGTVAVVNQSSNVSNETIQSWVDAVKIQADRDIAKFWGGTVEFLPVSSTSLPPRSDWYCGFFDNSDVANAAGWHDVGPNGEPVIKCFTVNVGEPNVTLSHEIAESISDTNANTTVKGFDEQGRACLYFREDADAVENEVYQINGIDISDFVTPQWFVANSKGPWDYLSHTNKPFQILQGGYMQLSYDNGATWTEVDKFSKNKTRHQSPHSRWALYKKPFEQRIKSTFKIA